MRKTALLLALLLLLSSCGAPVQEPPEPSAAKPSAVPWEGPGECYTEETYSSPENVWSNCSADFGGSEYSLQAAGNYALSLTRDGTELFRPEGSAGLFMRVDECGIWLVSDCGGGIFLRLYDEAGAVLAEMELPAAPRSLLLSGGRAWADLGGLVVSLSPEGETSETRVSARYQRLVRDAEGGLHTVAAADEANHVSPLGGGEGFTTGSGFVASGLGDSYLYLAKSDGVYVLDEKGGERLLICYEDCMINPKKLLGFEALSEGRFLCSGPGGQYILRPASPDEIGQKTELTLAIFADTPYIDARVAAFNSRSEEYKIRIVNYAAEAGSLANARLRLNTELGSGGGPDMVCFPWQDIDELGALNLIARDMLVDMTPWLDSDIGRANLMVWDALSEYGGVYVISDAFSCECMYGLKEGFGERRGMTIQEYLDLEASLEPWQDMCYHMDPAYFIEVVSRRYMRGAIDWETGTCDFDNPEFIALLKAAARVKEDRTDEYETLESFETVWSRMGRGQLMLSFSALSGIDVYNGMNFDSYYAGKEISYFGYPSPDGEDGLFVKLDFQLGVCATTKHQKGCRAFVRDMLLYSSSLGVSTIGLPLYRPYFEAVLQSCIGDDVTELHSEAEADAYRALVESADTLDLCDPRALAIIKDEAASYLSGAQSAEDTARGIQERMSIYVSEQS